MSENSTISTHTTTVAPIAAADVLPMQEPLGDELYKESLQRLPIQRKLSIGAPDDPLEHEADDMADKVMRVPEQSFIQKNYNKTEKKTAQRKLIPSNIVNYIRAKNSDSAATGSTKNEQTNDENQGIRIKFKDKEGVLQYLTYQINSELTTGNIFADETLKSLNKLYKDSPTAKGIIDKSMQLGYTVTIKFTSIDRDREYDPWSNDKKGNLGGDISWNPFIADIYSIPDPASGTKVQAPAITLIHELMHFVDHANKLNNVKNKVEGAEKDLKDYLWEKGRYSNFQDEDDDVIIESKIAQELHMGTRPNYDEAGTKTVTENSTSVNEVTGNNKKNKKLDELKIENDKGAGNLTLQKKCATCNEEEKIQQKPNETFIQFKCNQCEKEEEQVQRKPLCSFIQKKGEEENTAASESVTSQIQSTRGGGESLSPSSKNLMGNSFGADFSAVKIHSGNYASDLSKELNAQAFTVGNDIYFNEGKYDPVSSAGKHLLAHELTHVVQQGSATIQPKINDIQMHQATPVDTVQRSVPDDKKLNHPSKRDDVDISNIEFWDEYKLSEVKPLRQLTPVDTPNAYANRTYDAQKILNKAGLELNGKIIRADGILGPRTFLLLHMVAQDNSLADTRFKLQGLGFDLEAIASEKGNSAAGTAGVNIFKIRFLQQWSMEANGKSVLEHLGDHDTAITTAWADNIIFGGPAPADLVKNGLTLGDRFGILKEAYKDQLFKGRIALAEADRDYLDNIQDNHSLAMQDPDRSKENKFWVSFKAESNYKADQIDEWSKITYPTKTAGELRKHLGINTEVKIQKITGLLAVFYIPDPTEAEQERLFIIREEYLQKKAENIDDFIQPRAQELIGLLDDTDMSWYIREFKIGEALNDFVAREVLFEKLATLLESNSSKNYFEVLINVTLKSKNIATLQTLIQLCNSTRFKTYPSVVKANEILHQLKHSVQSHDYVTGTPDQQGVWLNKGREKDYFLGLDGITTGMYRIKESRQQIKEEKRAALQAKMEELIKVQADSTIPGQPASSQKDMDQDKFMEHIFEEAAKAVGISENDLIDVTVEEAFRLKGVKSKVVSGVEDYYLSYERVTRIGGEGHTWEVTEESNGFKSRRQFEEDLGWYKFHNEMKTLQKVVTVEAIIVGGIVLILAGPELIALAGGAKVVGVSIAISVLIYAVTAEHYTVEGFLTAVLTGYLMALGFRFFTPMGAAASRWVGYATFRQKFLGLLLKSFIVGGGAGGFTNVSTMLIEDILNGKLRSLSDYLKGAGLGILLGTLFEFGGNAIGPLLKSVGRNVLEKITNVTEFMTMLKQNGYVLNTAELSTGISKSFASLKLWMMENLEQGVAAKLLIDVMDKAKAILNSLSQSLEVSVHLQALELIENGMTREAVDALEKLVARSRVSLGTSASRTMLDDVMNKLVKEPGRANPFFSLVNTADENLMKILLKDSNLNKLATSDGILTLTGARSPLEITNLLHLQFEGSIEGFESWSQRLLKQGIDVQKQILDLLESRGSSVTPQSLLRVSETGTALSQEVIDGLGRLVSTARGTTGTLARFEEMIQLISNDKMESFLKTVGQLPKDKFDEIFQLVNEPAKAGRLINYTNDTQQLLNMLDSAGGKSTELDTLIEGTKKLPNASNEIESLLNRYSGNIEKLNEFAKQVNGDAALLERSIVKMGKKEVEEILQKGQAQAVTKTDPASMQRFLKMAESNSWADPGKLKGFIERIHSNQAQLFKHTFENALDRLDDFVVHHSKSTSPPAVTPGFGPLNLAAKDSFFEITLTGGTKITPHANANNLQHYKEGHTFENFWFDPVKIDRAGVSTFWPPGTIDDVLLKDLVDALQTNDCRTMIETQMGMGKSFVRSPPLIDLAGTKFQIGMNVPTKLEANMFFPMEGARAVRVSKHILHGVKDLLGL